MTTETNNQTKGRNWGRDIRSRLGVLGELFAFLWKVKLWWLVPMIVVLFIFAIFIVAGNNPLTAPFIYSLH